MGESKRRKTTLGDQYGKEQQEYILPWVPITKNQSQQFMKITTQASWVGIGLLVVVWLTIRFIGPSFGWWQVD